jgi:hypothetical protein
LFNIEQLLTGRPGNIAHIFVGKEIAYEAWCTIARPGLG